MSDTEEKKRFDYVSSLFAEGIRPYGLRPRISEARLSASQGWQRNVAFWAKSHPVVSIWFDNWLEDIDGSRHFWFGFKGTANEIHRLVNEAKNSISIPAIWNSNDDAFENSDGVASGRYIEFVRGHDGLVHEKYNGTNYFGKYDVGFDTSSDGELAQEAARFIGEVVENVDPNLAKERDIDEIRKRRDIDQTVRKQLIDARRGQGGFRNDLLQKWGGCAVSGCTINQVLRASHIRPWKDSDDKQRLDPNNGFLLSATFDALFDKGLISFDDRGTMCISPRFNDGIRLLLKGERWTLRKELSNKQKEYLSYHRDNVFLQDRQGS